MEMTLTLGDTTLLSAYVRASWGSEAKRNCRTRSGFMILYGEAVIIATRKLQKCVSFGMKEVEYVVESDVTKTLSSLRRVLSEPPIQ